MMIANADAARPSRIRVLLAGGGELVRRGIRDVLECSQSFVVAGEVASGGDLGEACVRVQPDLLLMSLGPDDAIDLLTGEPSERASAHTLVLLDQPSGDQALASFAAGAGGALLLNAPADALLKAARQVADGGAALDTRLLAPLLASLRQRLTCARADVSLDATVLQRLSSREGEVLHLLARGQRNKEISAQLGVSVGTVKTHLRHVFRKLDVVDRTGAVVVAMLGRREG